MPKIAAAPRSMKRAVCVSLLLLCVVSTAFAARIAPGPPADAPRAFTDQVTMVWAPGVDYAGNSVVRLTLSYSHTAKTPRYDALVVVARPSGRIVAAVVDPASDRETETRAAREAGRRALRTVRAHLDAFADELTIPFTAGDDQTLDAYLVRGSEKVKLATVRADLAQRFRFSIRIRPRDEADEIPGVINAMTNVGSGGGTLNRCMGGDWCVEKCVDCPENAVIDFYACTITCPTTPPPPPPDDDWSCD